MDIYFTILFFLLGTILGSFYNVVGYRLPKGESLISPPSHCPNCNKRLSPIELIPILSFVFQKGRCRNCKTKVSWFYPFFEFMAGLLFAVAYKIFGLNIDLVIALTFISMSLIIIVSDYLYMIINDEVLIAFSILFIIELIIKNGINNILWSILDGIIAFLIMFIIKKMGDFIFKKESMGGGDIKLLFVFGLVIGWEMSIISILLASFIGLPVSLIVLNKQKDNIIPFGPFLVVAAIIIILLKIDMNFIISLYNI